MSHAYALGQWYIFELEVRRAAPWSDELRGLITSHFWNGGEADQKPPVCSDDGLELVVKMPARGSIDAAGHVTMGGTSYSIDKRLCGRPLSYNLDHFEGQIDPQLQEFQSTNNDGGRFVNEPTVFRRVKCLDPPRKELPATVKPPAFEPGAAHRAVGCSR